MIEKNFLKMLRERLVAEIKLESGEVFNLKDAKELPFVHLNTKMSADARFEHFFS